MLKTKNKIEKMCFIALATAVICILGPLSLYLPVSPVPISLGIFGIYMAAYVLGAVWGTISCLLYIIIGLIGVPVFAAFTGGPQKLFGPTGGYIIGYLAVAFFTGLFVDRFEEKPFMHVAGMILGLAVCYTLGTLWLALSAGMTKEAALAAGVIPFVPADIVKTVLALITGRPVRKSLQRLQNCIN